MARDRVAQALAVAYWRHTPAGQETLALAETYNEKSRGQSALWDMQDAARENGDENTAHLAGLLSFEPGFQLGITEDK